MVAAGEDDLICDFAETYHIYQWRGLPADYAAVLACGLREDSRVMLRMAGMKVSMETMLRASIADGIKTLVWINTKDAPKGRNRPKSILEALLHTKEKNDVQSFATPDDFERRRKEILEGK